MQTGPDIRSARQRYVTYADDLVKRRDENNTSLGRKILADRNTVGAALRCEQHGKPHNLPTREIVAALDQALGADGVLICLWQDAVMEHTGIEIKLYGGGRPDIPWRTVDVEEGVGPTNRRELFEAGGLTAASVLAVTSGVTEQLSNAKPNISKVAAAEDALATLDRDMWAVHPAELIAPAFVAYRDVEGMLGGRLKARYVHRLTLLAGQLAAGLSTVCRYGGEDRLAREFIGLAEEHADDVQEPALIARVAGLHSCIAFNASQWGLAAETAARALAVGEPEQRARFAGYTARANAAAGCRSRAAEALEIMKASKRDAVARGVWDDAEEHLGIAEWAAHTPGEGRTAIRHGELAAETAVHDTMGVALAHMLIGYGHLDGERAAPDAAAQEALAALDTVRAVPNATVTARVQTLHRRLARWPRDPLVQELGRRVAAV
ncbi:conserved hypothetical protein [Frankia canadensis]|uniref:Uncharacterized protein n=1 Tax=Frankia canadensis TaxID=1836972 RepID=A0A2I2L0Z3_9ACTN|nr:hypothetical protein [Frankia canadensis]SNQ51537.1 conserved hypothetical protein [Frankia canadensis]SOU58827.1 conserved hypothetical protein [Frankia canadensis]